MVAEIAVNAARIGILAVLVAALGAYLYWIELPEAATEAAGTRVFPIEADAVASIAVHFPDRTIELARSGDDWRLSAPLAADADDAQVKGIVTSLTSAKIDRTLDAVEDRKAFGLDDGALRVELAPADGPAVSATIGRTTPIGSKTYVETTAGGGVGLTASNLRTVVDKKPSDLRNKQLLDFADDAITRIEIAHDQAEPVVLVRTERDAWTVSPGEYVADLTDVRSFLSSVRATRAVDFVDEAPSDLSKYGLAPSRLRVSITPGKGADPIVLLVGSDFTEGESTRLYAKRGDAPNVVALGEWSMRSLDKDVSAFRDKTILAFDVDRVARFSIERQGEGPLSFVRSDGRWILEGDDTAALDQTTVTRYLTDLRDLKGASIAQEPIIEPLGFGLAAPAVRVTLAAEDGTPIGTIAATKDDDAHYAMRVGSDVVFELRDYMYTRIDKAKDAFKPIDRDTPETP